MTPDRVCEQGGRQVCDYEIVRRRLAWVVIFPALAVIGALLAFAWSAAAAAAAGPVDTRPVRSWSVLKVKHNALVQVAGATQRGGLLDKTVDVGPAAFILEPILSPAQAIASVFSTADGQDYHVLAQAPVRDLFNPTSAKGSVTHLSQFQTYRKRSGEASLSVTISRIALHAVDDNGLESTLDCDSPGGCLPIEARVLFHLRAYTSGRTGREFFAAGGTAYFAGSSDEGWDFRAATAADANVAQWSLDDFFHTTGDGGFRNQRRAEMILKAPRTVEVPLSSVSTGRRFTVDVSLEAEATDDRGRESAVEAFIEDPQHRDPPLLRPHGLQALPTPSLKEPAVKPPAPARCSRGASRNAGTIQLSQSTFSAAEGDGTALVLVARTGGSHGATSVDLDTTGGSAKSGSDFTSTSTRVRFENGDASPRFVEIPVRQDGTAEPPEKFGVSLSHVRCAKLGTQRSSTVTIHDDDQPPPPPPPTFTIGGSVDGLQGSGLVLSDFGSPVSVSANGSFTFPGTVSDGQGYEISVATQPTNPAQICTVQNGKGTVSTANVTDIAVHCAAPLPPPVGLDTSFGIGGFASTPVSGLGQGNAVVIQPTGGIVTAGLRTVGNQGRTDFALTRHDQAGNLDPSFGTDGVATTDLGGVSDQALDAAVLPDNGIVAVGRTDFRGPQKTDFAVVRYLPDGTPNPNFGNGGIVTTPFSGNGAQANAVAVQPDGKIVVAGFALTNAINSDFAVARYNPDGSLDDNFGARGIVTTELGGENDVAKGLAIQSDGKIVLGGLGGPTGEDVALARYLSNGTLDRTFGNLGTSVTKIGFGVDVHGVALAPGGGILVAGSTFGATSQTEDFALAGFRNDGTLNLGFGQSGLVTTDFGHGDDVAQNLVVDDQGEIVLVGEASSSSTSTDLALASYKPDGSLDSFGRGGIFTVDLHGKGDFGQDLVIDSQNRIIAVGGTAGGDSGLALIRVFR
jgi:uncharacterized delta-60 repeat protein